MHHLQAFATRYFELLPQDAPSQALLLVGFCALIALLLVPERTRTPMIWLGSAINRGFKRVSAAAAWIVDQAIPLNTRYDTPVRAWFIVWILANLVAIGVPLAFDHLPVAWRLGGVVTLAGFLLLNTLFLCGAYWAMKEETALWHRKIRMAQRLFGKKYDKLNLSTARNPWIVGATVPLFVVQLAAIVMWAQEHLDVSVVTVRESIGVPILDFVFAIVGSTPAVLLMVLSGLSSKVFVAGVLKVPVGFFASSIVGVACYGLYARRAASQQLIEDVLHREDPDGVAALKEQVKMGPTLLKQYMIAAYETANEDYSTGNPAKMAAADTVRTKLLELATEKKVLFTAPAMFLRGYSRSGTKLQDEGTERLVQFLEHRRDIDETALCLNVDAIVAARKNPHLPEVRDLENAGRILGGCLEGLVAIGRKKPEVAAEIEKILSQKQVQECLLAMLSSTAKVVESKARELWRPHVNTVLGHLHGSAKVADIPRMLRYLQHGTLDAGATGVDTAALTLKGANNASPRDLDDIIHACDWLRHQPWPDANLKTSVARLRNEAVKLQKRNGLPKAA